MIVWEPVSDNYPSPWPLPFSLPSAEQEGRTIFHSHRTFIQSCPHRFSSITYFAMVQKFSQVPSIHLPLHQYIYQPPVKSFCAGILVLFSSLWYRPFRRCLLSIYLHISICLLPPVKPFPRRYSSITYFSMVQTFSQLPSVVYCVCHICSYDCQTVVSIE